VQAGFTWAGANVRLKSPPTSTRLPFALRDDRSGNLTLYMLGTLFTLSGDAIVDNGIREFQLLRIAGHNRITFSTNALFTARSTPGSRPDRQPPVTFRRDQSPSAYTRIFRSMDFIGSCFANSLTVNGSGSFHFDEISPTTVTFREVSLLPHGKSFEC